MTENQNICAIAYKLGMNNAISKASFTIDFTWAIETDLGVSMVAPREWTCKLPEPIEYVDQPFGTSSTRGILGGVAQPWLYAQSETIERSLGDACTVAFTEIIDAGFFKPSIIMVLGPAFPKVIGRFLSLRPPMDIAICWITPLDVPSSMEHLWHLLLPLQAGTAPAMAWSNESILNHFGYPSSKSPKYWVQYLDCGHGEKTVNKIREALEKPTIKIDSLKKRLANSEILPNIDLPRQLRLSVDVVQLSTKNLQNVEYKGLHILRDEVVNQFGYLEKTTASELPTYPLKNSAINAI